MEGYCHIHRFNEIIVWVLGKNLTKEWLEALPPDVDPCGEYGEYHTFVYYGPIFQYPIPIEIDYQIINGRDRWKFVGIKLR